MQELRQRSWKLPIALRARLRERLISAGAESRESVDGVLWMVLSVGARRATVALYRNGVCTLATGYPPAADVVEDLVFGIIEESTEADLRSDHEIVLHIALPAGPHIGSDESGKSDFFGPLVTAGIFADHALCKTLTFLGVRDCKDLSDERVQFLAAEIHRIVPEGVSVFPVYPKHYNDLYEEFQRKGENLNDLVAWAHAECIKELFTRGSVPTSVLVDQFTERPIHPLVEARRGVPVLLTYRAEVDVVVAAASIVARAVFLEWMEATSERLGIMLPKGTDQKGHVAAVARSILERDGPESLRGLVKLNVRTANEVFGDRRYSNGIGEETGERKQPTERPSTPWADWTSGDKEQAIHVWSNMASGPRLLVEILLDAREPVLWATLAEALGPRARDDTVLGSFGHPGKLAREVGRKHFVKSEQTPNGNAYSLEPTVRDLFDAVRRELPGPPAA
jgi:ribonuclease HIII